MKLGEITEMIPALPSMPTLIAILSLLTLPAAHAAPVMTDVIWAVGWQAVTVHPRTWTRIPWDTIPVNTLQGATVDSQGTWVLPPGIYSLMVETAWPNVHGVAPHRRKARVMQSSDALQGAYSFGSHETNSAVTCGCPDDEVPQTFLVEMQPGVNEGSKLWIEVWHNAEVALTLRGLGFEAQSFMLYRLGDL